ncbi:MAG: hypothetical protein R3Y46_00750 [Opitutales bacterium]
MLHSITIYHQLFFYKHNKAKAQQTPTSPNYGSKHCLVSGFLRTGTKSFGGV